MEFASYRVGEKGAVFVVRIDVTSDGDKMYVMLHVRGLVRARSLMLLVIEYGLDVCFPVWDCAIDVPIRF